MTKGWRAFFLATAAAALPLLAADQPKSPTPPPGPLLLPPADFKLVIQLFGIRTAPIATAELVVRKGVAYQFLTEAPEEVMIIDPSPLRVVLLDIERKVQTELTSKTLDAEIGRIHQRISATIEKRERTGTRADKVAAAMSRDLIEPRFKESFNPATNRLKLTNGSVDVEAVGEPEPDQARLNAIVNCLAAIAKIGAVRDPENLPPFTRLDALRALAAEHRLRPTEMVFLYRLAGPPRKLRWTYRLVPELTDREREALSRVDKMRTDTPFVRYALYERPTED
jgi:hypothetical protein